MRTSGLVLRDVDGYEWVHGLLRAKNYEKFPNYGGKSADWRSIYLDWQSDAATLPSGFELYDPFEKEPALFEMAARLLKKSSPDAVREFANDWGDLSFIPKVSGRAKKGWESDLQPIQTIASKLGKPISPTAMAGLLAPTCKVEVSYAIDAITNEVRSKLVTFGLRNSLLVQAAEAMIHQWTLRDCVNCGKPIAPSENRKDRKYCSDSCRTLAHRDRRKKARNLYEKGKTPTQIAAKLDTELTTVHRWLNPKGEKQCHAHDADVVKARFINERTVIGVPTFAPDTAIPANDVEKRCTEAQKGRSARKATYRLPAKSPLAVRWSAEAYAWRISRPLVIDHKAICCADNLRPLQIDSRTFKLNPTSAESVYLGLSRSTSNNFSSHCRIRSARHGRSNWLELRLSSALAHAVKLKLIESNAAREIRRPSVPKAEMKCWDSAEASKFLTAAKPDRLHAHLCAGVVVGNAPGGIARLAMGVTSISLLNP